MGDRGTWIELFERVMASAIELQPSEFGRKFQSLARLPFWKAVELRNFLMFVLPSMALPLKHNPATISVYRLLINHFVGLRLLAYEPHARDEAFISKAERLLHGFVPKFATLFGAKEVTIKVHQLYHLAEDVRTMGLPMYEYSAYPFENAMNSLKRTLHSPNAPLAQLHRRFEESYRCHVSTENLNRELLAQSYRELKGSHDELQHVIHKGTFISKNRKDSFFVLRGRDTVIITVKKISRSLEGVIYLHAVQLTDVRPQFSTGLNSMEIGVFRTCLIEATEVKKYEFKDLKNKLYLIEAFNQSGFTLTSMTDIDKKSRDY